MSSIRTKCLVVFVLYVAGVVAATHAGRAPPAPDAARLAQAYRDVIAAERALHGNAAAEATFGPMLRDARERLEAGIAASAEASVDIALPLAAPEAREPVLSATGGHPDGALATPSTDRPSGVEPPPRRHRHGHRQIWV